MLEAEADLAATALPEALRTPRMNTVQIVMADPVYAQELEKLLMRDGQHVVVQALRPDPEQEGVVVMDTTSFDGLEMPPVHPEQVVLVAGHEESSLNRAWEAGLRSVVYSDDPIQTTLLAVMAAELRVAKEGKDAYPPHAAPRTV